ncbi:gamma-glutamyl-gamma-aminobutyrate hydrolase family protein [Lutispora sp.]|uniref:gamma-glutamyl-gamma-aminobutyrate hydrolase family protein n=1 Tax=Lutispora sp. TaxID=2828727 RepID=UPI000EEF15AD|nr:gamma-glutamyl-gamma-aminobutyrate hydrolase family protein [Lutispora sp.]MEA4963288.1 gamma-glutamyl-gamma-aminobutyrate hydrolase family protein [Lutispora sp.]HCJ57556.1 gamma-glutamyl-gamma-aminobutyrate hydrolase [Clostridiaceae bacterium]
MRPLIGITAKLSSDDCIGIHTNLGCKNQSWLLLADDYIKSVEEMGGTPVVIPVLEDYKNILGFVDNLDGVIFSGGNDLNPKYYNEEAEFEYKNLLESLDKLEIYLYKKILMETDMPILGICRGLQLINTVHGGKLYQEMRMGEYPKHTYSAEPVSKSFIAHMVSIEENSLLHKIVKGKSIKTNSFHHQSIKVLGKGLKVNAISEDGIIEGIEGIDDRFLLAVQWHPEMLAPKESINDIYSRRIFEYFIKESENFSNKKKK